MNRRFPFPHSFIGVARVAWLNWLFMGCAGANAGLLIGTLVTGQASASCLLNVAGFALSAYGAARERRLIKEANA